ncbi:hypothetical protein HRI_003408300 [Hibiscus trionum]|uniref:Uncharacterized protein n=1 Tax=Hibiscus trionum TaxID=183268 RepID=A0A9W7ILV3_HIBTR|nr:hypothetical protein HRI_003408300 [Hibiscus trionum]
MARTMLCENNLPKYFWAEATNTACYIVNRDSCDDDDVGIIDAFDEGQTSKKDDIPTKEEDTQDPPLKALKDLALEEKEVSYPREFNYVKGGEILGDPSKGGLQIKQRKDDTFINQAKYIKDMLKKFGLENAKPQATPMISSTKLDKDEGVCSYLGSLRQNSVALSTTEVEYISLGSCCAQVLWMKQQLLDYSIKVETIPFKCDNTSAICLTKNPIQHSRTKHIEIRHHFIRDHVLKEDVVIEYVDTLNQLADIFTKPLDKERFWSIGRELGLTSLP